MGSIHVLSTVKVNMAAEPETCDKGCPELSEATASMRVQGWRTV